MMARLRSLLNALFRRSRFESELDEELRFHLETRAEQLERSGRSRADAVRRARAELGAMESAKDRCRDARGLRWPDELRQDLRFAFRGFRRNPGFTATAVLTLALGIGANAAVFTVVQSVLLQPLPYPEPERLVMVYTVGAFGPFSWSDGPFADPDYLELRKLAAFSEIAAVTTSEAAVSGTGEPARAVRSAVTASLFPLLRVPTARGRVFLTEDEGSPVAVLSDRLWRGRFKADPAVIGRFESVDGVPHAIVGVMPPAFDFPPKTELWTPLRLQPSSRHNAFNRVVGRLAGGVSAEQARAQVTTLMTSVGRSLPPERRSAGIDVVGLRESLVGKVRSLLLVFLAAVGCVLVIACTNIANLLLARAAARGQEMSVRATLGAGRARLVRQLLTESLALAGMGGALGLALARLGLPALLAWVPPDVLPRIEEVRVNGVVVGVSFAACLLTGLLFGLAPALSGSRRELVQTQRPRGASGIGRAERRVRGGLVVAQTALVMVLLVGAGLLLKSFWKLQRVDPGFRRDRLLTMSLSLSDRRYPTVEHKLAFYDRLLERIRGLPGAGDASAVNLLPFGTQSWNGDFVIEGQDEPTTLVVGKPAVSESYFRTMGIPLRRGRVFDDRDRAGAPRVAVVSETVARHCWPGRDPLGRRLTMDDARKGPWLTVVGVVGEVRQDNLAADALPMIYVPLRQEYHPFFLGGMAFVARADADPARLAAALRAQVRALDPELPVQRIEMLDRLLSGSLAPPRFRAAVLLALGLLALLLALVGVYGVTAYEVTRRTGEIGIRRALGAQTSAVLRLVIGRSMGLVAAGLAAGIAAALAATRALESFLFAVTPLDPATFVAVALGVTAVAALASAIPARRAARVDPAIALRSE
jgi:predicted permease